MMLLTQVLTDVANELRSEMRRRDRALLPGDLADVLDRIADRLAAQRERVPYNPDTYMEIDYDNC